MAAYCTIAEATAYMAGRLFTDAWDDATTGDQTKALQMATNAIDKLNFRGELADDDQTLQFPRYADTSVPDDIKNACAEEAMSLLDGKDPELEYEGLRQTSMGYANVRLSTSSTVPPNIVAGITSITAWRLLLPYLRDHTEVRLRRIN